MAERYPVSRSLRGLDPRKTGREQHVALGDAPLRDARERLRGHPHLSARNADAPRHGLVAHADHLRATALVDV